MAHELTWVEEKRIIHQRLFGQLDLNDATEAAAATEAFMKEGIGPVHLIVDVNEMKKFPTNVVAVNKISGYLRDPKLGWMVIVGANPLVNVISGVVSQVVKFRLSKAETVKDAIAFLKQQDPTLKVEVSRAD